jgi:two-component system chemotaxis response regulator CheY
MTLQADPQLVLFMDTCTGEIEIEGISCDYETAVAMPNRMLLFRTGLPYNDDVAAKIRLALDRRGVKVRGVSGKCINVSKDWLVQMLVLMYHGLHCPEKVDRLGCLRQLAEINNEWEKNPGLEVQKKKEKEYWEKVDQFSRAKQDKTTASRPDNPNNSLRILIVEDEELSRELMLYYFSSLGKCDIATNGLEAIEAFMMANEAGENYDLIALDIILPKMNGHEVLKLIRSIEEWRGLAAAKIIMTTAMDSAKEIMTSFKNQCDGYLVKPISNDALRKLLHEFKFLN